MKRYVVTVFLAMLAPALFVLTVRGCALLLGLELGAEAKGVALFVGMSSVLFVFAARAEL